MDAELRVLHVLDSLAPGGSERSFVEMLPELVAGGVSPIVACLHRRPGLEGEALAAGAEVRHLEAGGALAAIAPLRRLIRELRPSLVHSSLFAANLAARLAAAGTGTPVLTSLVNVSYDPARRRDPNLGRLRLGLVRRIDAWTARPLVDHFHAVSDAVRTAAVQDLGIRPARVTVIPRGRDPARLGSPGETRRRAAREALGLPPAVPVVVAVGRQEYQKGHRSLLEAAARLKGSHPELRILLAGRRGHASHELEALVRERGLAQHVEFLGHREDVPQVLAAADAFVLPSLFEGFPGAVVEAMALGLPVAGSDIGPLREVLGPGGGDFLAEPEDPAALAAVLDRLLRNPEAAAAAGRRNRERFLAELTVERSARRMLDLYRWLIDPAAAGRRRAPGGHL